MKRHLVVYLVIFPLFRQRDNRISGPMPFITEFYPQSETSGLTITTIKRYLQSELPIQSLIKKRGAEKRRTTLRIKNEMEINLDQRRDKYLE